MPAIPHRLRPWLPHLPVPRLPVLMLACAVVLVAGAAITSLLSLHDPGLAAIVAVAGCTGIGCAVAAYAASTDEEAADPLPPHPATATQSLQERQAVAQATLPRPPLRIQSLPVADLPPAYLAAVRKGAEANRAALKARADRA